MGKLKRTIKEEAFINAYIKNRGNACKAYLEVFPYVKKESAKVLGSKLLTKINLPITELLTRMGVTDQVLNNKLQQGLNATTGKGKEKKPNYYVIARYLNMIFRLKAVYPIDETRLRLPGSTGITSVTLKEIIYGKEGQKIEKIGTIATKPKQIDEPAEPESGETPPF